MLLQIFVTLVRVSKAGERHPSDSRGSRGARSSREDRIPVADATDPRATRCDLCRRRLDSANRGRPRRYCSRSCQARAYRARRALRAAGAPTDRRPPRPERLTRVTIARTAVALADRDGLGGLTMRRLAGDLGVATAALYRHYPDREALLSAMTELVMAEHARRPHPLRADPRSAVAQEAHREWRLYREHAWMLPVLARTRPPLGPALFDTLERTFAALGRFHVPAEELLTTYLALSGLVQGLALLSASDRDRRADSASGGDPEDTTSSDEPDLRTLGTHPTLSPALAQAGALDLDDLLTSAVALLLDGIAHRHATPLDVRCTMRNRPNSL